MVFDNWYAFAMILGIKSQFQKMLKYTKNMGETIPHYGENILSIYLEIGSKI